MSAVPMPFVAAEEYLAAERAADRKQEYVEGYVYARAGASIQHVKICANLVRHIGNRLSSIGCEVYSQDLRTGLRDTTGYFYPDVIIQCGKPELVDESQDILLNPAVLIEVLSKSTEAWDRGGKFACYRRIESLQEYILVSKDHPRIDRFVRDGQEWRLISIDSIDNDLLIASVDITVPLSEIYERVEFVASPGPEGATD